MAVVRQPFLAFLTVIIALGLVPLTAQPAQADTLPTVSIEDKWVWEGDSGETNIYLVVRLSAPSSEDYVIVDYKTQDGTANANTDYVPTDPNWPYHYALFEDGATVDTVWIKVKGDTQVEPNETFYVILYDPYKCTIADGQATVTIRNDDYPPTLSVNDVTVDPEGDSGTKDAVFTVSMSRSWSQTVTVDYSTADASAEEGADYQATSGTLTFAPGETAKTISVPVLGDMMDEYDEYFSLNLSNATNATIADSRGYGRIVDDDPLPAISVNDVVVEEGYTGWFTISLSNPSSKGVFVRFKTADGTAIAGADYWGWPTWGLGFNPGQVTQEFWLLTYHDTLDEPDETCYINLWDPYNATIADSQGVVIIQDNDPPPTLSVSDVTVDPEGDSGTKDAEFMVSLSQVSGKTITVDYSTADGTATSGADYQATSGTLTFTPGETAITIPVAVIGEMLDEFDETFSLNLSNPTNTAIADDEGIGTIVDDDPKPPVVSDIPDQSILEGESFDTIALDDYVDDANNTDDEISWSYSGNVELTVSIDNNRIATIGIPYSGWNGSETITFTATDPDLFSDSDEASFTVINVAPTVDGGPDQVVYSGDIVFVNATFTDPGILDTHTATINWGDGVTEPATVIESGGSGTVTGNHRYLVPRTYTVTVTVTDNDNGVDNDSFTVEVLPVPVLIDIKPGSDPNSINLGSKGVIPVAILTIEDFDAATVDSETVRFGPNEAAHVHYAIEDVDGDGDLDIILHFKAPEAGIGAEDTEAILTGQTQEGVHIIGVDAVRIVPPKATVKGNKK